MLIGKYIMAYYKLEDIRQYDINLVFEQTNTKLFDKYLYTFVLSEKQILNINVNLKINIKIIYIFGNLKYFGKM